MGQSSMQLLSLTCKSFTLKLGPFAPSRLGVSASFTCVIDTMHPVITEEQGMEGYMFL